MRDLGTGFGGRSCALVLCAASFVLVLAVGAPQARAWVEWNDGCSNCHGPYVSPNGYVSTKGGAAWAGSLHNVHINAMAAECDLCHLDTYLPTYLGWSNGSSAGDRFGCAGCHAKVYPGAAWPKDVGLVAIHAANTVETCVAADCHHHENYPSALPESDLPPYYGLPDSNLADPCGGEDFSGDGQGLDNDGDGLRDGADPDCPSTVVCGNGAVEGTEVCDGVDLSGESCSTLGFGPGALACQSDCSAFDTSGCGTTATCGNGTLDTGETCDPPGSCPTQCPQVNACIPRTLVGSSSTCNAECVDESPISACTDGDGCCPAGCDESTDDDCGAASGDKKGCGCSVTRGSGPFLVLLLLVVLGFLRRSRRRRRSR